MPRPLFHQGRRNETVKLNYFKWRDLHYTQKPYTVVMDTPEDFPRTNFDFEPGPEETIHDLRGQEDHFGLDANGFAVRPHRLQTMDFDKGRVQEEYLPEVERLLRTEVNDVTDIFFFDWRVGYQEASRWYVAGRAANLK